MITGKLKSDINKLWEEFWTGGIANPLTVIEQITFLMYVRLLDLYEQRDEKRKKLRGVDFKRRFLRDGMNGMAAFDQAYRKGCFR